MLILSDEEIFWFPIHKKLCRLIEKWGRSHKNLDLKYLKVDIGIVINTHYYEKLNRTSNRICMV